MKPCFVGIDTSNYTTSAAVCDAEGRVLANLKLPLPVKAGQRGLRQSDAVFEHVRGLPALTERLAEAMEGYTLTAVGASVRPRDAEGSYMPCFLAGRAVACALAAGGGVPVFEFSHQHGHIMAALYSSGRLDLLEAERFLAFHVSGGTTEALLVHPRGDMFDVELVGGTADINAGQLIDRVGVAMGLSFPCGRELEALAGELCKTPHRHAVCVRDGVCSLSGAENIALKIYSESGDKRATAAFVFDFIGRSLEKMCGDIIAKHGNMPVVFAGGVMSNRLMRVRLSAKLDAYFSAPEFSADNAAGTALLCKKKYMSENGELWKTETH